MNADIFDRVVKHLEPNPELYLKLSLVSKHYYHLFTRDDLWQAFDVYNLKGGIYKHYLKSERMFLDGKLIRVSSQYWERVMRGGGLIQTSPGSDIRFALLGHLVSVATHSTYNTFSHSLALPQEDCVHFAKCLVRLRPSAMGWAKKWLENDREFAIELVARFGCEFRHFNEEIRGDFEIVCRAISTGCTTRCTSFVHETLCRYVSPSLQANDWFIMYAVDRDWRALGYASRKVRQHPNVVQAALQQSPHALRFCKYQTCELVKAAVQRDGDVLDYALAEFTDDRGIIMIAVTTCTIRALEFASETLKSDKEVVMAAVKHKGCQLGYASDELRRDREIVLAAVGNSDWTLGFASEELRNDREIVLAAVTSSGAALQYASDDLRNDREVVLAAVATSENALIFASHELFNDRKVALAAVTRHGAALEFASNEHCGDREIVLAAVVNFAWALQYASDELCNDRDIVLAAVGNSHMALQLVSDELRNDRKIVYAAVFKHGADALEYASKELLRNKEFLYECIAVNERVLKYLQMPSYEDSEKATAINPRAIFHIPVKYKGDRRLAEFAVRKDSRLMRDRRRPSWWDKSQLLKDVARLSQGGA